MSIGQFYGIEINDFAVTVAKTALWIAESQMMKETEDVVHMLALRVRSTVISLISANSAFSPSRNNGSISLWMFSIDV